MPEAITHSSNGAAPTETVGERIVATERELVLAMLDELKRRAPAELRIASHKDPKTGHVELVYVGVAQKADLDALRKLYGLLRRNGPASAVTF